MKNVLKPSFYIVVSKTGTHIFKKGEIYAKNQKV